MRSSRGKLGTKQTEQTGPKINSTVHLPQLHVQCQCQRHHSSCPNEAHISISVLGGRKVYQGNFPSSPSSNIISPAVFRHHFSSTRRCCASNSRWATARRPRCISGAYRYSSCPEEEAGGAVEEGAGYAGDWKWYWRRLGEDEEILEGRSCQEGRWYAVIHACSITWQIRWLIILV